MNLTANKALQYADKIVESAGYEPGSLEPSSFLEYYAFVLDILRYEWSRKKRAKTAWLGDFLEVWAKLGNEYEDMYRRDPMMIYRPKHDVALAFHKSPAFIRYYRTGNRCAKTQSAYAEHYFVLTGQHPYRSYPKDNKSTCLLSVGFTSYEESVFGKKMLTGEDDNIISPMFPDGGKWFHSYNKKEHSLWVACPECAEKGRPKECSSLHRKGHMKLFSAEGKIDVMQGFAAVLAQIDEHVPEEFFAELRQRLMSVAASSMVVTGTPLHGTNSWETIKLANEADGPPESNRMIPGDPTSPPRVELFQIDQYSAGIVPHWKIKQEESKMDEFEKEARIYGRPAPLATRPVFDRSTLYLQKEKARTPTYHQLVLTPKPNIENYSLTDALYPTDVTLVEEAAPLNPSKWTGLRMWEPRQEGAFYVLGVDSASGLHEQDACVTSVLKVTPRMDGYPSLDLVAQFWGWKNMLDYADEVKKIGLYYNCGLAVIELTGGYGQGVLLRLRNQLYYPYIFMPPSKPELANQTEGYKLGVDTNRETKPMMVGSLQQFIKKQLLTIPCYDTIKELVAYGQEYTDSGLNVRFRGMGERDDRVMSLCTPCFAVLAYPTEFWEQLITAPKEEKRKDNFDDRWSIVLAGEELSPFV